ncbi:hypothetical protein MNAN1_003022 [Malassezia nana]|uniref:THO complex subunit 1 n=1 Tax=Malassezia nana TaxID=180528 RepID=A0AAF0J3K5_9BASI|nr:hypothetical protein MNAN1_003022 [Malassezia nana]
MREPIAQVSHALHDSWAQMHAALRDAKASQGLVQWDADAAQACLRPIAERLRSVCAEAQQTWAADGAAAMWDEALVLEIGGHIHASVLASTDLDEAVDRLDMALAVSLQGLGDPTLLLSALADLLEQTPIQQCMDLFTYAEQRAALLTQVRTDTSPQDMVPTAGKGLVFLRLCNELQRRLSVVHTDHAVLAGRILLLLSTTLPLQERSGVNLKGESNTAHPPTIEPAQEASSSNTTTLAENPYLYELYWSLQHYMAHPATLLETRSDADAPPGAAAAQHIEGLLDLEEGATPTPMQVFQAGVQCMLRVLPSVPIATSSARPTKRARTAEDTTYPAFLSARCLFPYQLQDVAFRRHFLVQCLVVFQYLLGQTHAGRERAQDWTNKLLLQTNELSDSDEQWTRKTWRQVQNLLRDSGPDGRAVLDVVLNVLRRESAWVQWKGAGAPSMDRAPLDAETYATWQSRVSAALAVPAPPALTPMGSAELCRLWNEGWLAPADDSETLPMDKLEKRAHANPSLAAMHEQMQQASEEAKEGLVWRALRCVGPEHLHLMACMRAPDDIGGLLEAMHAEAQGEAYEPETIGEEPDESEPETQEMAEEAQESEAPKPDEAQEPNETQEPNEASREQESAHEYESAHEPMSLDEPTAEQDARSSSLSSSSSSPLSTSEDDADPDSTFLTARAEGPRSPGE